MSDAIVATKRDTLYYEMIGAVLRGAKLMNVENKLYKKQKRGKIIIYINL